MSQIYPTELQLYKAIFFSILKLFLDFEVYITNGIVSSSNVSNSNFDRGCKCI